MASSDLERNDNLNEEEYVIFLNRLTNNEFIGQSFEELDSFLKKNFSELAGEDGQISIYGSKPDQKSISVKEKEHLENICIKTGNALNGISDPDPTPTPTPVEVEVGIPSVEPSGQMSLPPTFDESTCLIAIASSDPDDDDYMNQDEYTEFVVRLTGKAFEGLTFEELPSPLPETYNSLVSEDGNGIYTYGAKPDESPEQDQEEFLQQICLNVAVAYSQTEGWTEAPVIVTEGTFPPGISEGYNSFIVSNRGGLTADDLVSGLNRDGLDQAYTIFIERAIEDSDIVIGTLVEENRLRRRKLGVDLAPNSPEIYILDDIDCPEGLSSVEKCQIAFAKFQLTIDEEDPQTKSTRGPP
ncbi:unnamed protein product [Pseudo-nitzschia multistriata]|uniref:Uncharacterized protein n=1 Tax=Pseudo-nitzschia multistriata TaxID=183589 RepID=A0A448ZLA2_9STRA|nr:unnamed protein product [Pseudo-nitzschia multistriata]